MTMGNEPPSMGGPPPAGNPVNGTLILVLGILGLVCLPILSPVAWIMGNSAMATLNAGGGDESQRGMANIGRILGIVGTVLMILYIIAWILGGAALLGLSQTLPQQSPTPTQ